MLLAHFVGDAFVREADKLGERRVRPAATTGQRRDKAGDRRPRMAIEGPEVDRLSSAASRAAHPQKPMPRLRAHPTVGANSIGMRLDCRDEPAGVLEDLSFGRSPGGRFLLGGWCAPCLHLAAIETNGADFAAAGRR
jgi:hypothetical protein